MNWDPWKAETRPGETEQIRVRGEREISEMELFAKLLIKQIYKLHLII